MLKPRRRVKPFRFLTREHERMTLAVHARAVRLAPEPQRLGDLADAAAQDQFGDEQTIGPQYRTEDASARQRIDTRQPVHHVAGANSRVAHVLPPRVETPAPHRIEQAGTFIQFTPTRPNPSRDG